MKVRGWVTSLAVVVMACEETTPEELCAQVTRCVSQDATCVESLVQLEADAEAAGCAAEYDALFLCMDDATSGCDYDAIADCDVARVELFACTYPVE